MWQETVAPTLVTLAGDSRVLQHRRLKCFGAGESALEEMLPGLIERGRDPTVGITAHEATITLRISAWAASASECAAKISDTEQVIRDALGPLVYGEEDDEVEDAATQSLRTARLSLATVEAGTGGRVAALMAQAAARQSAAAVFRGGIVLPELSSESDTLVRAALHVAEQQGADLGLAVGPVRLSDERQAVDIVIASGEWREVHEHHLGGGDIALSRAAKAAIDRVRFVAADRRVGKLGGTS